MVYLIRVLLQLSADSRTFKQFSTINVQTKLVVLFPYDSVEYLQSLLMFFRTVRLVNILFAAICPQSDGHHVFNYMVVSDKIQVVQQYESLEQVFPEQLDFGGLPINACTSRCGFYSELDVVSG